MIRIEIENLDQVRGYLRSINRVNQDLRSFFRDKETPELKKQANRAFGEQGPGWAPLTRQSAIQKSKRFPGKGILERTGNLKRSYTSNPFTRYSRKSMQYASSSHIATYHETGTSRMPRRSVLESIARQNRQTVGPLLNNWLRAQYRERLRRFGFGN